MEIVVIDEFTVVSEFSYTVNSNDKWKAAIPEDLVYDTTREKFNIKLDGLEPGEHIVALRAKDSLGNTTYKTVELDVTEK